MAELPGRREFLFPGTITSLKQPNDLLPNKSIQSHIRTSFASRSLRIARENYSNNQSTKISNPCLHEICQIIGNAVKNIPSNHIIKSYPLTGFSNDESQFSKELKFSLAKKIDTSKLDLLH